MKYFIFILFVFSSIAGAVTAVDINAQAVINEGLEDVQKVNQVSEEVSVKSKESVVVAGDVSLVSNSSTKEPLLYNRSTIEIGLEYPLNFGTHVKYYLSDSFYARVGFGFMAEFFLDSLTKIAPSLGYLNEHEANTLSEIFANSFHADLRLGWFPYSLSESGGPYVELGLSGMFFGHGEVAGYTLSRALEKELHDLNESDKYSLKTHSYNGTVHVGYQIPFERLSLNVEVGLIKILHSQLLPYQSVSAPRTLNSDQEKVFKEFLKKKGWIFPTVSAWISFSF